MHPKKITTYCPCWSAYAIKVFSGAPSGTCTQQKVSPIAPIRQHAQQNKIILRVPIGCMYLTKIVPYQLLVTMPNKNYPMWPHWVYTFNIRVLHRPLSEFLDFTVGNQRFNIKKKTFLSEESLQIHSVKWYKSIGIS